MLEGTLATHISYRTLLSACLILQNSMSHTIRADDHKAEIKVKHQEVLKQILAEAISRRFGVVIGTYLSANRPFILLDANNKLPTDACRCLYQIVYQLLLSQSAQGLLDEWPEWLSSLLFPHVLSSEVCDFKSVAYVQMMST